MAKRANSGDLDRAAGLIDRIVGELDTASVAVAARKPVLREARALLAQSAESGPLSNPRLQASLSRLIALLEAGKPGCDVVERKRGAMSLKALARTLAALAGGAVVTLPMLAAAANVNDTIKHPATNASLTVTEVVDYGVLAVDADGKEYLVLDVPTIGGDLLDVQGGVAVTVKVIGYYAETSSGLVRVNSFTRNASGVAVDAAGNPITEIIHGVAATADDPEQITKAVPVAKLLDDNGTNPSDVTVPAGAGSSGQVHVVSRGSNGKNGRSGALFVPARSGGGGGTGPALDRNLNVGAVVGVNSPGVLIASIGGNGGDGGDGYLGASSKRGGNAGAGGNVTAVVNGTSVTTTGNTAHGVVAQSRAGVGGEGGSSYLAPPGSDGGAASNGGTVNLTNNVAVTTWGNGSHGVLGQSLGGGAGDGGGSYGLFGDSGGGGDGGDGGSVLVTNTADINTHGTSSYGVMAQSIGGQGGDAGNAGGIVAFTDSGGVGGNGGSAAINAQSGRVETAGNASHGLFAQSIGGSGGNAGATSGLVALGADGGGGGNAGKASITTGATSNTVTGGKGAHALFAQSIGGGGGNSGFSAGLVALGATGGLGGNAGDVAANHNGDATTGGAGSHGVFAQSIGGGGGSGSSAAGLVALGGDGSAGGDAGNVRVDSTGNIKTKGVSARGILAQSVGGGGGDASTTGGLVSLGGKGSGGGDAGDLIVSSTGTITTEGNGSDGIFAQSVGGGGGSGGGAGGFVAIGGSGAGGGDGGSVNVKNGGRIETGGDMARGVFAQSVGGGGGAGGSGGGVFSAGGSGGAGGRASIGGKSDALSHGGEVRVENSGLITTTGAYSSAVQAQSIGGGGGDGGNSGGGFLAIGGDGGKGGDGGAVTVVHKGHVGTTGADSHGVFAQSVGGGGGSGGSTVSAGLFFSASIGGSAGDGGDGGAASLLLGDTLATKATVSTTNDRSRGLFIQSVGGGGGAGGASTAVAAGFGFSGSLAMGGSGGLGGLGGAVSANGYVGVTTEGDFADGIFLQSLGGGGGAGGYAISVSASGGPSSVALAVGLGGSGGKGGDGGLVTMNSGGFVQTEGLYATGLLAQSVGGGGGSGGYSITAAASGGIVAAVSATTALGGSGGDGGKGGKVDVVFEGTLLTKDEGSRGALIQSVGGGGGSGGFSVAGSVAGAGVAGVAASAGVGGTGGGGGDGGEVSGRVGGKVETRKDRSTGVTVQSVGGGGGAGGFNVSGAIGGGGAAGVAVSVGVGGAGGGGGTGGKVVGSVGDSILTSGDQSDGLLVQSVGGGGGSGGFNVTGSIGAGGTAGVGAAVGIGGAGGDGGSAGYAEGSAEGVVLTKGDQSTGVIVQSVGGGGGSGGFNVAGSIGVGGTAGVAASVGVGGFGGGGGDGGEVVGRAVSITTEGDQSGGFLAQSVGGGGGSGGFNVAGAIAGGGTGAGAISVGVGGSGGDGGLGGKVTASIVGDVTTLGKAAKAVVAQSVGGGGGSGGINVSGGIAGAGTGAGAVSVGVGGSGGGGGNAGEVSLSIAGITGTAGLDSEAILAQSVGGGGGSGAFNITAGIAGSGTGAGTVGVSVGGQGGDGGDAGAVILDVNGGANADGLVVAALTERDGSRAIIAQSVGGGGGSGGFSVVGGVAVSGTGAGNVGVGVGGGGGGGGKAGTVSADVTGLVLTKGDDAGGLLAQSVGGGGGSGGFSIAGAITAAKTAAGNVLVGVGGFGGDGGDGASVRGEIVGDIQTGGDRSYGLTYQSLGGGGGNGGFNVTAGVAVSGQAAGNIGVGVGGFGGGGGDGDSVTLDMTGSILTTGDKAHGALLQSVGGGGGSGAFNITGGLSASQNTSGVVGLGIGGFGGAGGTGGDVTGKLIGDLQTEGDGSFGALLQSVGGAGGSGGMNVTGAVALSTGKTASVAVGLGLGGFAGGGGNAGNVSAEIVGKYLTLGDDAGAVSAQSIGGGGGNGGLNVSGAVSVAAGTSGAVSVGVGGFGGDGGDAGDVSLIRVGDTFTKGADSDGVRAQSVGGGGGAGGINVSGALSLTAEGNATSIALGLGGFGGGGGNAGDVSASVTGNVVASGLTSDVITRSSVEDEKDFRTRAGGSNGVVAQSIGGGGGIGGLNVSAGVSLGKPSGSSSRAASIGIGGFGGGGGDAGKVDLTIGAPGVERVQVSAIGDDRSAVIAQSIGGGGGSGGINISGSVTMDGALTAGVGGFGGAGGLGRTVDASVDADVFAAGDRARGLMIQSIGGGGGAGAINISGGLQAGKDAKEPSLVFGLGGFGGAANRSDDVTVNQNGLVMVEGVDAIGVLVQSVAGGGGSGGLNVSANVSLAAKEAFAVAVGVGGTGGEGADAGKVKVDSVGDIIVNGQFIADAAPDEDNLEAVEFARGGAGLLIQSIGGGGGVGGINVAGAASRGGSPIAIGVGGSGGSGGHGGTVTVTRGYADVGGVETAAAGLIRTFGDGSSGMVVQSIGGGGGSAGMNLTLAVKTAGKKEDLTALISVGGSGAGAGSGDTVDVRHNGVIVTDGLGSDGLVAQSIGGGGGNANYNIGLGVLKDSTALNLAVGGATGAAGSGGDVSVDHVGDILTAGDESVGLLAQSIGGGGGNTVMDMAVGILAKSSVSITVGRHGGQGGEAGDVDVNVDGRIQTAGDGSTAIVAQSIGGGGGKSSASSVGASSKAGNGDSSSASMSVGLEGGEGATAGDVTVGVKGDIFTQGDEARGVLAQSIGGGGGVGGTAGATIFRAANAATVAVGGSGGKGAESGVVSVDNDGSIITQGEASDGVLAQSIGGGGGLGGSARTIAIQLGGAADSTTTRTATLSVGGTGGEGAVGNTVSVANRGLIATSGDLSYGIRAQSIGGGGGVGGSVISVRLQGPSNNQSVDLNLGGKGGTGGAGGQVLVENEGLIVTKGRDAAGVSANSIGGGGGDAGIVLDILAGVPGGAKTSERVVVNLGGTGGTGGSGGDVSVINRATGAENSGWVITEGDGAYGLFAQSLGGGGGNGSTIVSIQAQKAGKDSASVGLNVGGAGGVGESGGEVSVFNSGLIDTSGGGAHGIFAQSIGGGGGNGGLALAAHVTLGAAGNAQLVSVGGRGGSGGDGGDVDVDNAGEIVTRGVEAHGIVAQSIGGGGGSANLGLALTGDIKSMAVSNLLSASLGAVRGGAGGLGGTVTVNHTGDITVLGEGSVGIKAESINGGGGSLSLNFEGLIGLPGAPFIGGNGNPKVPDTLVAARAGGEGQVGMNAELVSVTTSGTFGAAGDHGVAALSQSIGGGGGTINVRASLASAKLEADAVAVGFQIALGGVEGDGNGGGAITTQHAGNIATTGSMTAGVLAQSIGGGGGVGVGLFEVPADGLLGPIDLALGALNSTNETGGAVSRLHTGAIRTTGALAPAAILQSIGGGGGSAMTAITGAGAGGVVNASLGAFGGAGLSGGAVDGDFTGGIMTTANNAIGLMLQSIGGGGGDVRLSGATDVNVALGGVGGASGDGAAVSLSNAGLILTTGARGHGVLLQSIGGGGGAVIGAPTLANVTLNSDNSGTGGAIDFTQVGDIIVGGASSYGLIAQSLGGGGGWVDGVFAGTAGGAGAGGDIDLSVSGVIFAAAEDAVGVFAQSLGQDGAGDISVALNDLVRGGSGTGVALELDGGEDNQITTSGSLSAVSGWAMRASGGNENVGNTGLVVGNLDLGAGDNRFLNNADGTFIAFDTIDLRDGSAAPQAARVTLAAMPGGAATFTNAGEFLMGLDAPRWAQDLAVSPAFDNLDADGDPTTNLLYGARVITTVELDGHFVQTADGHMRFDVAFGPYASDRVNVTGDATVAGTGTATLTWLADAKAVTLFATEGAGTNLGLEFEDTIALDYRVTGDAQGVHLGFISDFGQRFLRPNERLMGGHMDSALLVGEANGIGRLMAALGNMVEGQEALYASLFTELNPEGHVASLQTQYAGAGSFTNQLFGCSPPNGSQQDRCVWGRGESGRFEQEASGEYWGAKSQVYRARFGVEQRLNADWSLVGSFGYNSLARQNVDGARYHAQGDGFDVGVGARRQAAKGLDVRLSASAGWQWLESQRRMEVFEPGVGQATADNGYGQIDVEVGHLTQAGGFFARPALAMSATALRNSAFDEDGLDGLGIKADAHTQVIAAAQPKVTLGYVFGTGRGVQSALSLTAGRVHRSNDMIELPVRFIGAQDQSDAALIGTPLDRSAWRVGVSAQVATDDGIDFRVGYEGEIGDTIESHTAAVNVRWRF